MNLERIERLKGLLSRVERNAKKARASSLASTSSDLDVQAKAAPSTSSLTASAPSTASLTASAPSFATSSVSAKRPDSVVPLVTPLAKSATPVKPLAPAAAASHGLELDAGLEDVALDELAVELPAPEAAPAMQAPSGATAKAAAADRANAEEAARQELKSAPTAIPPIEDLAAEDIELEDVSFDDIAEAAPPVSAPSHTDVQASAAPFTAPPSLDDLTFSEPPPPGSVEPSQPPPVSARKVVDDTPDSIDAALIAATATQSDAEAELEEAEAPLLTPPPESGRQPTRPSSAQHPELAAHRPPAPTLEQLGEVVELEEARGPALELGETPSKARPAESEDLEFVPPASVQAPAEAPPREALSTLVGATLDDAVPEEAIPPSSRRAIASARPSAAEAAEADDAFAEEVPTTTAALAPEVTARRPVEPSRPVVDVVAVAQGFRPRSFLELLDASLSLGKKS